MIIKVPELTNFQSSHGYDAEVAIQQAVSVLYGLPAGNVTQGYFSDFDFVLNGQTFELKISSKGMYDSLIELARADGSPSGLTSTKAKFHMFLNNAGKKGKLRIIRTDELQTYYSKPRPGTFTTKTRGDKIGSTLAKMDFKQFNDIMIAEMNYNPKKKEFNTSTIKGNSYANRFILDFIK